MQLELVICLPRDAETVSLIRAVARQALASFGVTAECVDDITVALSEACTNVIEHAADDDEYEVEFNLDTQQCSITVLNRRNNFDALALDGVMPDEDSPRGRGVAMMHALMDSVAFTSEPTAGTIVHLVKRLAFNNDALLARLPARPPAPS